MDNNLKQLEWFSYGEGDIKTAFARIDGEWFYQDGKTKLVRAPNILEPDLEAMYLELINEKSRL